MCDLMCDNDNKRRIHVDVFVCKDTALPTAPHRRGAAPHCGTHWQQPRWLTSALDGRAREGWGEGKSGYPWVVEPMSPHRMFST